MSLNIGCPVVLITNLTSVFLNGMTGIVTDVINDCPVISMGGKSLHLEQRKFAIFDTQSNTTRAQRVQFPIKLAYAMTVHKAQGQTIPQLVVDCSRLFKPGQLGVAVGRAVNKDGLQIRNYHHHAACMKHLSVVYKYYDKESQPVSDDLQCCLQRCAGQKVPVNSNATPKPVLEQPPSAAKLTVVSELSSTDESTAAEKPQDNVESVTFPWDVKAFTLEAFPSSSTMTDCQKQIQEVLLDVNSTEILDKTYCYILRVAEKLEVRNVSQLKLCSNIYEYLSGSEFQATCMKCLGHTPSEVAHRIISRLAMNIWQRLVGERSAAIVKKQGEAILSQHAENVSTHQTVNVPDILRAKVRYIGRTCIVHVVSFLTRSVNSKLHSEKARHARSIYATQRRMLLTLTSSESDVMETSKDQESLTYITERMGGNHGLAHMSDTVFHFFLTLYCKMRKIHTMQSMHIFFSSLLQLTRCEISEDAALFQEFTDLFQTDATAPDEDDDDQTQEIKLSLLLDLYDMTTEHFNRIHFVDLLHKFKETVPKMKGQALRPSLQSKTRKQKTCPIWRDKC